MAVYYKFKSAKDFNSIPIDGHFISVANLKEKIFESKQLGRGTDFDLMVANAQTNEEYIDEATLIPKNTSVLVRRVPGRPRMNIVAEPQVEKAIENKVEDTQLTKTSFPMADSSVRIPEENEWDEFGNDLYAIPEVLPAQTNNMVQDFPPPSRADEDNKIKALVDSTALEWQRQTQEGFGAGRGYGRGMGGRMMGPARGFGRGVGGMEWKTPPPGYICFRCKVPGHFIQHCPTNGDPTYDIKRVKPPTGIPKSMLMTTPDGSYALPSGAVAVLKPNEAAFEKEIEGLPSTRTVNDLPPELRCPLCREVMKDAVLTSKCCFKSYCDKCIRDHIISKLMCVCGATNVLADDLLPNRTVRETINRILESNNSSAENGGSMLQIQDMASARSGPPKIPSPAASAASKGGHAMSPVKRNDREETSAKVQLDAPLPQVPLQPLDKGKATKLADTAEAMDESMNVKEHIAQGSAPTAEKVMQKLPASEPVKKKKKKKAPFPVTGADLQWRGPQDLVAENYMMPYGPSGGNPYWGGMQLGMEGYMGGPFMSNMPYMGYVPGPFDMPIGGFMPQDHFGGQGYMMPVVQQQRDLAQFAMGPNHGHPIMSREEFEARKAAEVRRKNEMEQRREREYLKDRESGREISSSSRDLSSSMKSNSYRPEIKSQSSDQQHHSYHHQRQHRSESERVAPPPPLQPPREAESVRLGKRRPEIDEEDGMSAADKKHKRSVFARISFSEGKKKPSTTGGAAITGHSNGYKEYEPPASSGHHKSSHHHHHHRRHDREEVKPAVGVGGGGGSRRREVDSSDDDEDDDDDRHFKRKPSRYNPPPQSVEEEDDDDGIRSSRRSRERDHHHERHRKHR